MFRATEKFRQLSLFPDIVCSAFHLAADSRKYAFCRIWVEDNGGSYTVLKESGIKGRVLYKRAWRYENLDDARKLFERRIKAKTNPERRSLRKYQLSNLLKYKYI